MVKNSKEPKKRGLGRGLEALFDETPQVQETEEITEISLDEIRPNPYQPRKTFDNKSLKELSESIKENGVFQPIIIRKSVNGYEIIAGERRFRASKLAKKKTIPAIIREFDEAQMMEVAVLENLQREDLTPLEEAQAYEMLQKNLGLTQAEVSKRLGKSRPYIANYLRLLTLPQKTKRLLQRGELSMGQARTLLGLKDKDSIDDLARKVVKNGITVRQLESLVAKLNEKEKKPKRELTPRQVQQRRKMIVFPLMFLAFAGCMYLIFAPSGKEDVNMESVGGFNADIPLPAEDGIIADKQKAYEQVMMNRKQQDKIQSLQDFGFTGDDETEEPQAEIDLMPEDDAKPQRGGGASSRAAYRDINRQLSTFYETPAVDEEKEDLKRQVAELTDRLQQQQNATPTTDDQMALLEKSYELAARYMNDGGQVAQVPVTGGIERKPDAVTVQAIRETTVSGLQQPMSDADFIRAYSQPRNYGFNTAVGTGYVMGKNTVAACIHQDQTLTDGQAVKLRLLEPMQAGNIVVPKNTLVAGTAKVQGERLDIVVSSIEYAGNIIPVELAVFDTDGQKGLSVPSSMEQEAFNEAMANIGSGLGTSISFAQSAGQQVAMDVTRGLLQGTSGYLAKKFRTVKVKLKAGYKVMLYAKQQ